MKTLRFRFITPPDVDETARLMAEVGASFARGTSLPLLRALCRDASRRPSLPCVAVLLATGDRALAGYVLLHIGGPAYFRRFARQHPLLAGKLSWKRVRRRLPALLSKPQPVAPASAVKTAPLATDDFVLSQGLQRTWADPGLQIARVQHIGVHPRQRGQGIGQQLYHHLFNLLPSHYGVTRIDANIDATNYISLLLHQRTGWQIYDNGDHYFATIDLEPPR